MEQLIACLVKPGKKLLRDASRDCAKFFALFSIMMVFLFRTASQKRSYRIEQETAEAQQYCDMLKCSKYNEFPWSPCVLHSDITYLASVMDGQVVGLSIF